MVRNYRSDQSVNEVESGTKQLADGAVVLIEYSRAVRGAIIYIIIIRDNTHGQVDSIDAGGIIGPITLGLRVFVPIAFQSADLVCFTCINVCGYGR